MRLRKLIITFFTLLILIASSHENFCQSASDTVKITSIIVMPFDYNSRYPFATDEVCQALNMSFSAKGFKVNNDQSSWNSILKYSSELVDLDNDLADSITTKLNIDLIVYGLTKKEITRAPGTGGELDSPTQILIKVYDSNKKKIVYRDRIDLKTRWGVMNQTLSTKEFGDRIVDIIKKMGY